MNIKAYAKINLTLDITGIMDNGFHSLRSVMVPVSLYDEITLEKSDSNKFTCNLSSISGEDNLCVRAAKAFFEKSGIDGGVSIHLEKNIPFPAGLGGGSADAAAVLKGLNELYEEPLNEDALFEIAASLGSDISVCLLGQAAVCEGKGDLLTPLSDTPSFDVVIAIGEGRLSTPEVYREYDKANLPVRKDTEAFLSALYKENREEIINSLGNSFEPVVDILCPETKVLREKLIKSGAETARLSGSGPAVYGIFKDAEAASLAVSELEMEGYAAFICKIL